jgi:hypothetical protein
MGDMTKRDWYLLLWFFGGMAIMCAIVFAYGGFQ